MYFNHKIFWCKYNLINCRKTTTKDTNKKTEASNASEFDATHCLLRVEKWKEIENTNFILNDLFPVAEGRFYVTMTF